jgi:hypothetical protein
MAPGGMPIAISRISTVRVRAEVGNAQPPRMTQWPEWCAIEQASSVAVILKGLCGKPGGTVSGSPTAAGCRWRRRPNTPPLLHPSPSQRTPRGPHECVCGVECVCERAASRTRLHRIDCSCSSASVSSWRPTARFPPDLSLSHTHTHSLSISLTLSLSLGCR